jgi:hypothetical protein
VRRAMAPPCWPFPCPWCTVGAAAGLRRHSRPLPRLTRGASSAHSADRLPTQGMPPGCTGLTVARAERPLWRCMEGHAGPQTVDQIGGSTRVLLGPVCHWPCRLIPARAGLARCWGSVDVGSKTREQQRPSGVAEIPSTTLLTCLTAPDGGYLRSGFSVAKCRPVTCRGWGAVLSMDGSAGSRLEAAQ